jgi:hypothetical protein
MSKKTLAAAIMMGLLATACTTYYEVSDPGSGKTYYTTDIDRNRDGSVEFKDAVSGSLVTIQSSEIKEVNKETYKANTPKN